MMMMIERRRRGVLLGVSGRDRLAVLRVWFLVVLLGSRRGGDAIEGT